MIFLLPLHCLGSLAVIFFLFLMKEQMCVWAKVAANRKPRLVQGTCTSQCSNTARAWWMFLDHLRTLDNISHLCHSASCRHCRPRMACSPSKVSKGTKLQLPAATCSYLYQPNFGSCNTKAIPHPRSGHAALAWPLRQHRHDIGAQLPRCHLRSLCAALVAPAGAHLDPP